MKNDRAEKPSFTRRAIVASALTGAAFAAVPAKGVQRDGGTGRTETVAGSRLFYHDIGSGRPILFLHGWSLDHRSELLDYEPVFARRPGWRRIYPDMPGAGSSVAADSVQSQDAILDVVRQFIDRVIPGQRFLVAGTSAGAYLAQGLARSHAQRMDGLLLRLPVTEPNRTRRTLPRAATLVGAPDPAATRPILVRLPGYMRAFERKMTEIILPALARADKRLGEISADPARYGFSSHGQPMASPFTAPALIMAGRQDSSVGYKDIWPLLDSYPRATFAALDRADHDWPVETSGCSKPWCLNGWTGSRRR